MAGGWQILQNWYFAQIIQGLSTVKEICLSFLDYAAFDIGYVIF